MVLQKCIGSRGRRKRGKFTQHAVLLRVHLACLLIIGAQEVRRTRPQIQVLAGSVGPNDMAPVVSAPCYPVARRIFRYSPEATERPKTLRRFRSGISGR